MNPDLPKKEHKGWYDRGYLPHLDYPTIQFVTFRLADSVPKKLIETWKNELRFMPKDDREAEERRRVEKYIDQGYGSCVLLRKEAAQIVQGELLEMHGRLIELFAWIIMPNDVHFLARFEEGSILGEVMKHLKGRTSRFVNKEIGKTGTLWYREYFDRYIRDLEHFDNTLAYVHYNPVKAGLCQRAADWEFSSAWMGRKPKSEADYDARRLKSAVPGAFIPISLAQNGSPVEPL